MNASNIVLGLLVGSVYELAVYHVGILRLYIS